MRNALASICRRIARCLDPKEEPSPPTEPELKDSVTQVCYEMAAMERAAEELTMGGRFRFEACLLHARLLREFLWNKSSAGRPGAENSLLAEHYFPQATDWRNIRCGLPKTLKATKDRIDRQLAHLARDRDSSFMNLEDLVPQIVEEIMAQWTRFEESLPPEWAKCFEAELIARRAELSTNQC